VGIPAVLAVPDVLERLEEGTVVRVDGEHGTLTVVAPDDG
jgi:phosphoenolpyruvate-protein kinase (PTS system EI component)